MDEQCSIVTSATSKGKEIMTESETISLAIIKPSDIGKVLRVKAYRKWTAQTSMESQHFSVACSLTSRCNALFYKNELRAYSLKT